jgi:hypothetical protein
MKVPTLHCSRWQVTISRKEQGGRYLQRDVKPTDIWESSHAKDIKLAEKLEKWTQEEMTKEGWVEEA